MPLGVEQHGIFDRGRKHAPLFEADDEEKGTIGNAGLHQSGHVEVAGPGSIATDAGTFDTLANEAERHRQRATERAERTKVGDGVMQCDRRGAVERARPYGIGSEKCNGGFDGVLNRDLLVFCACRDRSKNRGNPREQPFGSTSLLRAGRAMLFGPIRIVGDRTIVFREAPQGNVVGGTAPARFGFHEQPRGLTRGEIVDAPERDVARLEKPAQNAGCEIVSIHEHRPSKRASGAGQRRGQTGTDRDRPIVAARLFPHERRVLVSRTRNFDLIE